MMVIMEYSDLVKSDIKKTQLLIAESEAALCLIY